MKSLHPVLIFIYFTLLSFPFSQAQGKEPLLGAWSSPNGKIKFYSKNRYRSISGSMRKWKTVKENTISINDAIYQFTINNNVNTGVQTLILRPINEDEIGSEISYFRKIPIRPIDKELLVAVLDTDLDKVKQLINLGANPYTTDYDIGDKKPAYQLAIDSKNAEIIRFFFTFYAKINKTTIF